MDSRCFGIIAELRNNEEEIITFFKGLNSEQLEMMVYPDDPGWTVQQVLAHFITIERSMQWLFKDILAGGPGSPEDFDLNFQPQRNKSMLTIKPAFVIRMIRDFLKRYASIKLKRKGIIGG
jgi:hypothetical protein